MKWINVKDDLPPIDQQVIVYNECWYEEGKHDYNFRMGKIYSSYNNNWLIEAYPYYEELCDPTHWIPLPEKPE